MHGNYPTTTRNAGQFCAIALVALLACVSGNVRALTVTEFPVVTAASGPQGIAVGADGNLWFTEFGSNQVGRITTAGVVTEFPAGNLPFYIAAGPDGNLWFTEFTSAGKIGRMTLEPSYLSVIKMAYSYPTPGQYQLSYKRSRLTIERTASSQWERH